jgi:hypothetical protein
MGAVRLRDERGLCAKKVRDEDEGRVWDDAA